MGAAAFFRSRKEQKMSEFNHFAKELDAAFRAARSEYAAVYEELTKAKENASAAGLPILCSLAKSCPKYSGRQRPKVPGRGGVYFAIYNR